MTSKQQITEIKKLLSTEQIAYILVVSNPTVESWTKSQKGARNPDKINAEKINNLYEKLKPCFDNIKNVQI